MNDTLIRPEVESYTDPDLGKLCDSVFPLFDQDIPCGLEAKYGLMSKCSICLVEKTSLACIECLDFALNEEMGCVRCRKDCCVWAIYYEEIK